ncbi:MAG: hypothetical protein BWX88_05076 [Planctomycetes bacterium ADurb.Bin126]|nr:MAG: hypothetical protein BWX88_05076 [Planctomycetes bacterium ADurb.Bin126]
MPIRLQGRGIRQVISSRDVFVRSTQFPKGGIKAAILIVTGRREILLTANGGSPNDHEPAVRLQHGRPGAIGSSGKVCCHFAAFPEARVQLAVFLVPGYREVVAASNESRTHDQEPAVLQADNRRGVVPRPAEVGENDAEVAEMFVDAPVSVVANQCEVVTAALARSVPRNDDSSVGLHCH